MKLKKTIFISINLLNKIQHVRNLVPVRTRLNEVSFFRRIINFISIFDEYNLKIFLFLFRFCWLFFLDVFFIFNLFFTCKLNYE